jgi:Tetratricopeptide repeat/HEAT repeats
MDTHFSRVFGLLVALMLAGAGLASAQANGKAPVPPAPPSLPGPPIAAAPPAPPSPVVMPDTPPIPAPFIPDIPYIDIDAIKLQAKASVEDAMRDFAQSFALNFQNPKPRPPQPPRPPTGRRDNEESAYSNGIRALDNGRWDEAAQLFTEVISFNGSRTEGAMYWLAWAQNKQGNSAGAMEWLARLLKAAPNSRWIPEARALEVEIRRAAGQAVRPESVPDDEIKLMAINSLVKADEQRAIPLLENLLKGTGSPRLKERALFVLAQNSSPRARQVVSEIAKGNGNPDLQSKALTYLGAIGGADSRQTLLEVYKGTTNLEVKRSILRAFMQSGDRERLLDVARTEANPDLRAEAVQQLGAMGVGDELWQIYQKETSVDVKRRIIQSMFVSHSQDRLLQLVKTETDPDLLRSVVRNLGMMPSPQSTDALAGVYGSGKDESVRRAVIDVLSQQRNATMLIQLARKESDPKMQKYIVERLGNMKSTEATDYFLELLNKP